MSKDYASWSSFLLNIQKQRERLMEFLKVLRGFESLNMENMFSVSKC